MLARDDNERVTRVGPGTPMGSTMRRYWLPALLGWELPEIGRASCRERVFSSV